jgi:plastocyanin
MPFTWQITIKKNGAGFTYDPPQLNAAVGDQIFWTNEDDNEHWPGIAGNPTYFMADPIAPDSPSSTFVPGVTGTVTYIDSLHATAPGGTIVVS